MAVEASRIEGGRRIPAMACTVPFLVGMVLIYVGERLVGSPPSARLILDGLGTAGVLWAVLGRSVNRARSEGERRSVEGMILASYLGGVASLLLYAVGLEPFRDPLLPRVGEGPAMDRILVMVRAAWPIVWLSSVLPLLFMEISAASMFRAPRIEGRRVAFSAGSGLAVAWLLASLFLLNYAGNAHNRKWDMSFQRTASPSEDALRLVENLTRPFEVFLFYPEANEVLEELFGYFEVLSRRSELLHVRVVDHVMEPKLAQELGARNNGTVVYRYGDRKEVVRIGEEIGPARGRLPKVDEEFQNKFLQLVAEERIAYFTTGHGERAYEFKGAQEPRHPVTGLRKILKKQNFDVKPLGIGQGLGAEVPEDAALLLTVDPSEDFLPEELDALRRYLEGGGRMWMALDPEHATNLHGLLEEFGLRFQPVPLASERYFMRASYNKADRYNIFTNRTSSHPSVTTLSQNASRLAVVFLGSGYLEKVEEAGPASRIVMTLRSMPDTWADRNGNMEPDSGEDRKKTYNMGGAVTAYVGREDSSPAQGADELEIEEEAEEEMRMIVLADADALSDQVIGNLGNYFLFEDGLKWLFEEEPLIGSVGAEEDVRIMHTRQEDVVWFYTTIFAVPLFVLGVGVLYNYSRLRHKRKGKTG